MNDTVIGTVIFSGVLGLVGFIFSIIGIIVIINRKRKKLKCTSKVYGKVINIIRKQYYSIRTRDYFYSWHPVFEYNIGELKFTKVYTYGNSIPTYEVGQNVELYFNPKNLNEYYVQGEISQEIFGKTFVISGIVLITIAVFCVLVMFFLI